jgi:uncharacterized membrane protein
MRLISLGLFLLLLAVLIGLLNGGVEGQLADVGKWLIGAGIVASLIWFVFTLFSGGSSRGSPGSSPPFSY